MSSLKEFTSTERVVSRQPVKLPPRKWAVTIIITDKPTAGDDYLPAERLQEEFLSALDLPGTISCDWEDMEIWKEES